MAQHLVIKEVKYKDFFEPETNPRWTRRSREIGGRYQVIMKTLYYEYPISWL